ncbi:hypothetical protein TrST_g9663 [Triparma strigata]|uniref:Calcineurin-like phosphoesterase domain-containing protein n=1 Tax=Triparma strigata TaxID=1606541 RepID=A0A9W7AAS6_9STRA|nr:hypothetical protein TrST_g9663 [Triparma strigata]
MVWVALLLTILLLPLVNPLSLPVVNTGAPVTRVFAISDLHVDAPPNLAWVEALERRPPLDASTPEHHALLVAGDVSCDLGRLEKTLRCLRKTYDSVFYVPGNHEKWSDGYADSLEKLDAVLETAHACDCRTAPAKLVAESSDEGGIIVAPLFSWYHASFDTEPELPSKNSATFARRWQDFRRCSWPKEVASAQDLNSQDTSLAEYFAALNDCDAILQSRTDGDMLLTLSHFLPSIRLLPEKRFMVEPMLAKVVGSSFLGKQVRELQPDLHVFGHSHIPIDLEIDGTLHVQWPLGSVKEQKRQCERISREGPLEVARSSCTVSCRWPGDGQRTVWGSYYSRTEREPERTDLAPWVIERQTPLKERKRSKGPLFVTKEWVDSKKVEGAADDDKA